MTERIILEVDGTTAKKWRASSYRLRTELCRLFDAQINRIIDESDPEEGIQFFKELRAEMKEKGLTQEILDDILDEKVG